MSDSKFGFLKETFLIFDENNFFFFRWVLILDEFHSFLFPSLALISLSLSVESILWLFFHLRLLLLIRQITIENYN